MNISAPEVTDAPFDGACRYMDWLMTVPLLLLEIRLVMKLLAYELNKKAWTLGLASALMIVSGCHGELVITGDLAPRWACWFLFTVFFVFIMSPMSRRLTTEM